MARVRVSGSCMIVFGQWKLDMALRLMFGIAKLLLRSDSCQAMEYIVYGMDEKFRPHSQLKYSYMIARLARLVSVSHFCATLSRPAASVPSKPPKRLMANPKWIERSFWCRFVPP